MADEGVSLVRKHPLVLEGFSDQGVDRCTEATEATVLHVVVALRSKSLSLKRDRWVGPRVNHSALDGLRVYIP